VKSRPKFLLKFILFLLSVSIVTAAVSDIDRDGVADSNDRCSRTTTDIVDQQGCDCYQKKYPCAGTWCCESNEVCVHVQGRNGLVPVCVAESKVPKTDTPPANDCIWPYCNPSEYEKNTASQETIQVLPSAPTPPPPQMPVSPSARTFLTSPNASITTASLPASAFMQKPDDTDTGTTSWTSTWLGTGSAGGSGGSGISSSSITQLLGGSSLNFGTANYLIGSMFTQPGVPSEHQQYAVYYVDIKSNGTVNCQNSNSNALSGVLSGMLSGLLGGSSFASNWATGGVSGLLGSLTGSLSGGSTNQNCYYGQLLNPLPDGTYDIECRFNDGTLVNTAPFIGLYNGGGEQQFALQRGYTTSISYEGVTSYSTQGYDWYIKKIADNKIKIRVERPLGMTGALPVRCYNQMGGQCEATLYFKEFKDIFCSLYLK